MNYKPFFLFLIIICSLIEAGQAQETYEKTVFGAKAIIACETRFQIV